MAIRDYRFDLIDATGNIAEVVTESCDGDEAAIMRAVHMLSSNTAHRTIHIWSGERRIAELGAENLKPPVPEQDSPS
jgi:hypothetical protein